MNIRVTCNLIFNDEKEAQALWKAIRRLRPKLAEIHPDTDEEETSSGNIHFCFHDEDPTKPCKVIEELYDSD